jgi:hypothetical protein
MSGILLFCQRQRHESSKDVLNIIILLEKQTKSIQYNIINKNPSETLSLTLFYLTDHYCTTLHSLQDYLAEVEAAWEQGLNSSHSMSLKIKAIGSIWFISPWHILQICKILSSLLQYYIDII